MGDNDRMTRDLTPEEHDWLDELPLCRVLRLELEQGTPTRLGILNQHGRGCPVCSRLVNTLQGHHSDLDTIDEEHDFGMRGLTDPFSGGYYP